MNKKYLLIVSLVGILAIPIVVSAGLVPCGGQGESECTAEDLFALAGTLMTEVVKYSTFVAGAIFVYAGVKMIISGPGDKAAMKSLMKNVVIGIMIIWGAYLIISTLLNVLNVKTGFKL